MLTNPVIYKTAEGETYAIASRFHANAIIADWNAKLNVPQTTEKKVTVQAFMLGDEVAMVSIPGEPFDYYYKEPGVYTPENNMWNDLLDDTYGKPFVLGYCNGASGYFPNYEAYNYNRGRNDKAIGSYEVHTSDYGQGTGERMLGYLNQASLFFVVLMPKAILSLRWKQNLSMISGLLRQMILVYFQHFRGNPTV